MIVKICGMSRQKDLDLASRLGVDWCGFIFHEKSPRYISPNDAAKLSSHGMKRVGVFVEHSVEEILKIMAVAKLDLVELHGIQGVEDAIKIGVEKVIRVLWPQRYVQKEELVGSIQTYHDSCAYFLVDAGIAGGGSGNRVDMKKISNIDFIRPWLLAGGLSANNMDDVMRQISVPNISACTSLGVPLNPLNLQIEAQLNPYGFDINSGIEDAPSCKNEESMKKIMSIIREKESEGRHE